MKRWDLMSLRPSTEKRIPRDPGPDAPRVPRRDGRIPRVLFTSPECRAVIVELRPGEAMGDHHVRERAVVQVVSGRVEVECSDERSECGAGTLLTFDPRERHGIRALDAARLLLILAPWPSSDHYVDGDDMDPHELPANAVAQPAPAAAQE